MQPHITHVEPLAPSFEGQRRWSFDVDAHFPDGILTLRQVVLMESPRDGYVALLHRRGEVPLVRIPWLWLGQIRDAAIAAATQPRATR